MFRISHYINNKNDVHSSPFWAPFEVLAYYPNPDYDPDLAQEGKYLLYSLVTRQI